MVHLEWWKFGVDLLLMGSLAYLCLRFARSPQTAKLSQHTIELEQTLRTLIRDAEDAGQALNDQLRNRQDALEKVLAELEGGERRVKRLLLDVAHAGRTDSASSHDGVRESAERGPTLPVESPAPEPPSFDTASLRDRTRTPAGRLAERIERSADPVPTQTNIYGEPLPPPAPRAASGAVAAYRSAGARPAVHPIGDPVPARAERAPQNDTESEAELIPDVAASSENSAIDEVYKAAEQMLRAGKDLQYVSARTELPMEEVRVLKQIIIREQAAAASRLAAQSIRSEIEGDDEEPTRIVSEDDPRLGVLTAARRTNPSVTA